MFLVSSGLVRVGAYALTMVANELGGVSSSSGGLLVLGYDD